MSRKVVEFLTRHQVLLLTLVILAEPGSPFGC